MIRVNLNLGEVVRLKRLSDWNQTVVFATARHHPCGPSGPQNGQQMTVVKN